ncbi:MAG TPA: HAMP domain-containing sensor histidine kinase [Solirubrobacterales bacterium]|nr:HAMP domain-containing sensor histidine kinase [Solirubrobacterales bacterium]
MGRLNRLRATRIWPSRWPIRWKLAAVSSGLTFVILVAFGVVVGQLTTQQLRDNYAADTEAAANELVSDVRKVTVTPAYSIQDEIKPLVDNAGGPADVRLFISAIPLTVASRNAAVLGDPQLNNKISDVGKYQVATLPYETTPGNSESTIGIVRVGRPIDRLQTSINRIWVSVLAGTLGATLLAALAGVVLSRRAMRPISNLTSAAGQIAKTRDPSVTLPDPVTDDEVSELTLTFNDMLHELSLARSERERSLNRQREFVADASHELRTPLTSVLANLELLEHSLQGKDRELELESVESALRSSQRMKRLVADLQILARADSGRAQTKAPCDLAEIARNAVEEVTPLSEHHRIELRADAPVIVNGAADDLHRVVLNLVDNAVRHTPEGSTITVTVGSKDDGERAWLSVADDGPGIPEELRPQIFDRFVRNTGPGDRASAKGTGLGLAIVSTIAKGHDGVATVGDSASGGAMFMVDIPTGDTTVNGSQGNR